MTDHSFITGESLRTRMARHRTSDGWSEPEPYTNLLGAPIGNIVEVSKWDCLVLPRCRATRRVREFVEAMYCPEGWYCTSGSPDQPLPGGATCNAVFDAARVHSRDEFNAFHATHPVVWRIRYGKVRASRSYIAYYCNDHLAAGYRVPQTCP
jgi:hypothetical protein